MTQQTIGNTVYTVGQKIEGYNDGGPLFEYMRQRPSVAFYSNLQHGSPYSIGSLKYTDFPIYVIALPNPDPVADEWREVRLLPAGSYMCIDLVESERHALQIAMQEVCKADEVKYELIDGYPCNLRITPDLYRVCDLTPGHMERIITCFLLGGKVSVKGGG